MTRFLSITAAAALLASTSIALAQTTNYSSDRYQPSFQSSQTPQPNRFGTSRTDRFGSMPMSGSTTEPRTTAREPKVGMSGQQFASESDARARCGTDVVWVNTKTHVYHFPSSPEFGHTKHGAFMCQADADRSGTLRAAKNETRGRMGSSGSTVAPTRNSSVR